MRDAAGALRGAALAALMVVSAVERDASGVPRAPGPAVTACEGRRPALDPALFYELRAGAFPAAGGPDVAVHVPPGFDATRRPGLVLYFHGWNGCVAAALSDDDVPCTEGGEPRPGARLAAQMDEAGVNALLVAVELRVDQPSGEPGQLASPAGARELVRELFQDHLTGPLGCTLELEALDRIVLVSHSGGYQAAASVLERGDLPSVTSVVLLDSLYGGEAVFASWMTDALRLSEDDGPPAPRRFVDLYTCCGGTLEPSRAMAKLAHAASTDPGAVVDIDTDVDGEASTLALKDSTAATFLRVATPHGALPREHFVSILKAQGFARVHWP